MSKKEYKSLRQYAIEMSLEWREYHLAQMESALGKDHTRSANDQLEYASRAEKCANWLKTANKTQFNKWYAHYQTTGSAIVGE